MSNYITDLTKEQILMRIEAVGICERMEIKNKKELYRMLRVDPPKGGAKRCHDNILRCFFDWEKVEGKQNLIITEIYKRPLPLPKRGRPRRIDSDSFNFLEKDKKGRYAHIVSDIITYLLITEHPEILQKYNDAHVIQYAVFRRIICGGLGILPTDFYKLTKKSERRNDNIWHLLKDEQITEQEILLICNIVDKASFNFFKAGIDKLQRIGVIDYYSGTVFKNVVGQWRLTSQVKRIEAEAAQSVSATKSKWRDSAFSFAPPRNKRTQILYDHFINENARRIQQKGLYANYKAYIVSVDYNRLRGYFEHMVNHYGELGMADGIEEAKNTLQNIFKQTAGRLLFKEAKRYPLFIGEDLPEDIDKYITPNLGRVFEIIIDYWFETNMASDMIEDEGGNCECAEKNAYSFFNEIMG